MDRNDTMQIVVVVVHTVALRKESVDRNFNAVQVVIVIMQSLSARRAWIEIGRHRHFKFLCAVALRKESVDRNTLFLLSLPAVGSSLSARRAWIEIQKLLKKSIDKYGRSPQGERG